MLISKKNSTFAVANAKIINSINFTRMKKALLCGLAAMMLLCSFDLKSLFGGSKSTTTTTTTAAPTTNADGKAAGKALRTLYTSYKETGSFNYKDPMTILNTISLVNSCKNLKEKAQDKTYWTSFASGLVSGSENLVTEQLSNTVTTQLNNIVTNIDTEKLESAAEKATAVKSVAGDVTSLLQMFK